MIRKICACTVMPPIPAKGCIDPVPGDLIPDICRILWYHFVQYIGHMLVISKQHDLPPSDVRALLNLIVMDALYQGALSPGRAIDLTPADRDHIFYSQKVPVFVPENEKVINRHIYAVALSMFLASNDDVYSGDNASVFLNEGGYERFKDYLLSKPEPLKDMLRRTLPGDLLGRFKIETFGWIDGLIGEDGVLEIAVLEFKDEVHLLEATRDKCRLANDDSGADQANRALKMLV